MFLYIAFQWTNNTIKDLLMTKATLTTAYCNACISKLICFDCQKAYVSQTGRQLRVRYKEHIHSIRLNRDDLRFAVHILKTYIHTGPENRLRQKLMKWERDGS
jgi:hypothetical protein